MRRSRPLQGHKIEGLIHHRVFPLTSLYVQATVLLASLLKALKAGFCTVRIEHHHFAVEQEIVVREMTNTAGDFRKEQRCLQTAAVQEAYLALGVLGLALHQESEPVVFDLKKPGFVRKGDVGDLGQHGLDGFVGRPRGERREFFQALQQRRTLLACRLRRNSSTVSPEKTDVSSSLRCSGVLQTSVFLIRSHSFPDPPFLSLGVRTKVQSPRNLCPRSSKSNLPFSQPS